MKNGFILALALFFGSALPVHFILAQNTQQDPIQLAPVGQGTIAPSVYGENNVYIPSPVIPPPVAPTAPPTNTYVPPAVKGPTATPEAPVTPTKSFLSGLVSNKLKIDLHGAGKSCMVGLERPVPWTLVNAGIDIDSKEELLVVLNQALQADSRIRRIVINENSLEIDYLQPARLFGAIPINYLFKIKVDTTTFVTQVVSPRFLSFATSFHGQVTQTLMSGLTQIYTPQNLDFISKQNLFYKHSFATAATTAVMTPIDVYPFADNFWICVIVPFFIVFLILFGLLFGFILYWLAKKRRERYMRRFRDDFDERTPAHAPSRRSRPAPIENEPENETLDEYIASKRFK